MTKRRRGKPRTLWPDHPAVDWKSERVGADGWSEVLVQCPECPSPRWVHSCKIAQRIKVGTCTGRCKEHPKKQEPKFREGNMYPHAEHPAIDWETLEFRPVWGGARMRHVQVTCLMCGDKRWVQPGVVAKAVAVGTFSGKCSSCLGRKRKHRWIILSPGRKIQPNGYVQVGGRAVAPEDRWLFDAMRKRRTAILEHRLVMAREIGRPLTSDELVDHMDGNKTNNHPSNLRIYIRGKQMPGDIGGYGVFYDEWQRAEARVRELEARLAEWEGETAA